MISAEPNEIARVHLADDIEPCWHVRLPSGMVTMTLDELDAAFQRGAIGAQTLVAREDECHLRPLGVVAGLFEEERKDVPRTQAQSARASHVSGVRPMSHARRDLVEPAAALGSASIRAEAAGDAEANLDREAMFAWQSAPERWLGQARTGLRQLTVRAVTWFAARSPRQRWALGALLVASLAAVCALGPAESPLPAPLPSAQLAAQPRSFLARPADPTTPQRPIVPPAAAPSAAASIPSRAVEPSSALDVPSAREGARHGSGFAERRKAARSESGRRSSRTARASRRRAGRE